MTAAGVVSDYDEDVQEDLVANFAETVGVNEEDLDLPGLQKAFPRGGPEHTIQRLPADGTHEPVPKKAHEVHRAPDHVPGRPGEGVGAAGGAPREDDEAGTPAHLGSGRNTGASGEDDLAEVVLDGAEGPARHVVTMMVDG